MSPGSYARIDTVGYGVTIVPRDAQIRFVSALERSAQGSSVAVVPGKRPCRTFCSLIHQRAIDGRRGLGLVGEDSDEIGDRSGLARELKPLRIEGPGHEDVTLGKKDRAV